MTPERRQQIDEVLEAALECEPAKQAAFLAQAYAGDDALRHEVESLLETLGPATHGFLSPVLGSMIERVSACTLVGGFVFAQRLFVSYPFFFHWGFRAVAGPEI